MMESYIFVVFLTFLSCLQARELDTAYKLVTITSTNTEELAELVHELLIANKQNKPSAFDYCQALQSSEDPSSSLKFLCEDNRPVTSFLRRLEKNDINFDVTNLSDNGLSRDEYHSFQAMSNYLHYITEKYPEYAKLTVEGTTHEGRDLYLVTIGSGDPNNTKGIWIDAGVHAREWIAPSVAFCMIQDILNIYSREESELTDEEKSVKHVNWYIMPQANPDGYEFSRAKRSNRYWRKNRSPEVYSEVEGKYCAGVDLNRNFADEGYGIDGSNDSCSEVYKGKYANSEPEVATMSRLMTDLSPNTEISLSLHCYGQLWATSFGYTTTPPEDNDDLIRWAEAAVEIIHGVHGSIYEAGPSGTDLYLAGGASDDFNKHNGVKYVATVELQPTYEGRNSRYGFKLPESMIRNVCEEIGATIPFLAQTALNPSMFEKSD